MVSYIGKSKVAYQTRISSNQPLPVKPGLGSEKALLDLESHLDLQYSNNLINKLAA